MRVTTRWMALLLPWMLACSSEATSDEQPVTGDEDELIGGSPESRYLAVGYLTTDRPGETDRALCGATLIAPNVVVTAAHCAARYETSSLSFGVGQIQDRRRVRVSEQHVHPKAHLEAQGSLDAIHALRLYDVAYLVLERAVDGVVPASIDTQKPAARCNVRLVAYGPSGQSSAPIRKGVDGCVVLNAKLGSDTIVEVRPTGGGAVCQRDGDEGHAVLRVDGTTPVLEGLYVGSVTQSFTDCKKYLQLLNGYEATYGYRSFYEEGIQRGADLLAGKPTAD